MGLLKTLTSRNGDYTLSWLLYIYDKDKNVEMRYVSDNTSLTFENQTYEPGTFSYLPNASTNGFDGGGKVEISTIDNLIIDLIETYRLYNIELKQIAKTKTETFVIRSQKHKFCKVSVERGKASFDFDKDDRQSMTFPSLIWSTQNNRGNK